MTPGRASSFFFTYCAEMSEHAGLAEEQQRINSLGEHNHQSLKVVPLPHLCALSHPSVCAGRCLWLTHRLLAEALFCLEELPTTCTVASAVTVKAHNALAALSSDHYMLLLALAHNLFLKNVWLFFWSSGVSQFCSPFLRNTLNYLLTWELSRFLTLLSRYNRENMNHLV